MTTVHVAPQGDRWVVEHEGDNQPISVHDTQAEAEQRAKSHARQHGDAEVVVHGSDGSIVNSDTMDPAHESATHDEVR